MSSLDGYFMFVSEFVYKTVYQMPIFKKGNALILT